MEVILKRKEVPAIVRALGQVKGMKDFKKAISLSRDLRILRKIVEETEEASKTCKPENFDSLAEEFRNLKFKKAKEFELKDGEILNEQAINAHVLLTWPNAKKFNDAQKSYTIEIEGLSNQEITIDLHTELTEKDLPKCAEDIAIAEALSYFIK
jgi:hypothetical protein